MRNHTGCQLMMIFLAIITIPLSLYAIGNWYFSLERVFEMNWGVKIPSGYDEIYHVETVGFHGDGERYTIYEIKCNEILFSERFSSVKDLSTETFTNKILWNLKVPKEKRPDFEADYGWCKVASRGGDGSSLIVIYDSGKNIMYFVEQHM